MKPVLLILLLIPLTLKAEDAAVPVPVSITQYSSLLVRPPFRRALGLSGALVLSGAASLPSGNLVTVWNRATKESFSVTRQPNAQGWKLVELKDSTDLKNVSAVIASGDQTITLRFDPERLAPPKLDNNSRPAARTESQIVVEALLRGLDPAVASQFEGLPPASQEGFRKAFAGFLGAYPAASDGQRIDFVRRALIQVALPAPPADAAAAVPAAAPQNSPASPAPSEK